MILSLTLAHLFPAGGYTLQDDSDGEGSYIKTWAIDAPQPTEKQLAAAWEAISPRLAWQPVRDARAPLLIDADHMINQLEDTGGEVDPWRDYRQALRDVTKGPDPYTPIWPTRPA